MIKALVGGSTAAAGNPIIPPSGVVDVTGVTYTLSSADNGRVLRFTNGSDISLSLAIGLPVGFSVVVIQHGTGRVNVLPGSATRLSYNDLFKTLGQYATIGIISAATNVFYLTGELGV